MVEWAAICGRGGGKGQPPKQVACSSSLGTNAARIVLELNTTCYDYYVLELHRFRRLQPKSLPCSWRWGGVSGRKVKRF